VSRARRATDVLAAALLAAAAAALSAQEPPPTPATTPVPTPTPPASAPSPPPYPEPDVSPTPSPTPAPGEEAVAAESPPAPPPPSGDVVGRLNIYFPEGRADLRFLKPIRNSLFETQLIYDFVGGDISAFLRYKYYGDEGTSTLTVFDEIAFDAIEELSNDFSRTRGLLFLYRLPVDFYNRVTFLGEVDRLTFSDILDLDNNKTNTYVKAGYQYGTPSDNLSNAVVGEARDRVQSLFTAFREIGPQGRGLSVAATWGFDFLGGDYSYVKTELEALQAVRIAERRRLFLRLHLGYFPYRRKVREPENPELETPFLVPRYELFPLGGRDFLKGYRGDEREPNQVTITGEYPVPVFTEAKKRFVGLDWTSLYVIGYAGVGNAGSDGEVFTQIGDWKLDLGAGLEAAVTYRSYRAFVSALVAHTVVHGVGGVRFLMTFRTAR
jgi:hypothetical protein